MSTLLRRVGGGDRVGGAGAGRFRCPSAWTSVALAAVSWVLAVLLWQAWPRAARRDRGVGRRSGGAEQPPVGVHS